MLRLLPKKATYVAKNFGCCKGRSKLSVDIFMASGDLLVAQKDQFLQKSPQKKPIYREPPPGYLTARYTHTIFYITALAKQGGG